VVAPIVATGETFGVAKAIGPTALSPATATAVDDQRRAGPGRPETWPRLVEKFPALAANTLQTVGARLQENPYPRPWEMSTEQVEKTPSPTHCLRLVNQFRPPRSNTASRSTFDQPVRTIGADDRHHRWHTVSRTAERLGKPRGLVRKQVGQEEIIVPRTAQACSCWRRKKPEARLLVPAHDHLGPAGRAGAARNSLAIDGPCSLQASSTVLKRGDRQPTHPILKSRKTRMVAGRAVITLRQRYRPMPIGMPCPPFLDEIHGPTGAAPSLLRKQNTRLDWQEVPFSLRCRKQGPANLEACFGHRRRGDMTTVTINADKALLGAQPLEERGHAGFSVFFVSLLLDARGISRTSPASAPGPTPRPRNSTTLVARRVVAAFLITTALHRDADLARRGGLS